jgi:hypothetical protein
MATSVPSECAFLSGGLLITKHHLRLKRDIAELIQVLKGAERQELFPPYPCSVVEDKIEAEEEKDNSLMDEVEREAPELELDNDCDLPDHETDDFAQIS